MQKKEKTQKAAAPKKTAAQKPKMKSIADVKSYASKKYGKKC